MNINDLQQCSKLKWHSIDTWHGFSRDTSHHIETTDAGLDGLCIREISVYHSYEFIIRKIANIRYNTTVPDAMEICFVVIHYILI